MDDIVKQAMAKWPNVPHCYGWLALDARGAWRMRDERAQHFNLPGDKVIQEALIGFINRNYAADERGCWYFQNGPQRVFVDLESTPFVARTDPACALALHTGEALAPLEHAFLSDGGAFLFKSGARLAQLDDRDAAQAMAMLESGGRRATDEELMAWMARGEPALSIRCGSQLVPLEKVDGAKLEQHFGFVRKPQP